MAASRDSRFYCDNDRIYIYAIYTVGRVFLKMKQRSNSELCHFKILKTRRLFPLDGDDKIKINKKEKKESLNIDIIKNFECL